MRSLRFAAGERALTRMALLVVCLGLALTFAYPSMHVKRARFDGVVALDITQSMNVLDYRLNGQPVSRLAFAKHALGRALLELPCGSKLGWAVFTEYRILLLLEPVEVCANRRDLAAVLDRIDNRMAWAGASKIALGLYSGLRMVKQVPNRPALVFMTDGHEAPPVNPGDISRFDGKPGEVNGTIVGVGALRLSPIPKFDPEGRPLGFWEPQEVMQNDRFSSGRSASVPGEKMVDAAGKFESESTPTGTEHLSSLKEAYLKHLARETGLSYRRLENAQDMSNALQQLELVRDAFFQADMRWLPAGLALLSLLLVYAWDSARAHSGRNSGIRLYSRSTGR